MGEQRRFRETRLARTGDNRGGYARDIAEQHLFSAQCQRDQGRARLHDLQAELPCEVVSKAGRTHFRNRGAAGGDHQ
ncbi:hypothetical protein TMRH483_01144 [Qipengyuania sp. 483]